MKKLLTAFCLLSLAIPAAFAGDNEDPAVVPSLDLSRYVGKWYEIAHSPNFFQNGCVRSTADYGRNADGSVSVLNTCFRGEGKEPRTIKGKATVVDSREPAKLEVDFGFFRKGDYWVVALDPNYQWSVVSASGKRSLFILSRTAPMPKATLDSILRALDARGFDVSELIYDRY